MTNNNIEIEQKTNDTNKDKTHSNEYDLLYKRAKSIRTKGLISVYLSITIIGLIPSIILNIICGVEILKIDWKDSELKTKEIKTWGVLAFIIPIFSFGFGVRATRILSKYIEN